MHFSRCCVKGTNIYSPVISELKLTFIVSCKELRLPCKSKNGTFVRFGASTNFWHTNQAKHFGHSYLFNDRLCSYETKVMFNVSSFSTNELRGFFFLLSFSKVVPIFNHRCDCCQLKEVLQDPRLTKNIAFNYFCLVVSTMELVMAIKANMWLLLLCDQVRAWQFCGKFPKSLWKVSNYSDLCTLPGQ